MFWFRYVLFPIFHAYGCFSEPGKFKHYTIGIVIIQQDTGIWVQDQSEAAQPGAGPVVHTMGGPSITPVWSGSVFSLSWVIFLEFGTTSLHYARRKDVQQCLALGDSNIRILQHNITSLLLEAIIQSSRVNVIAEINCLKFN